MKRKTFLSLFFEMSSLHFNGENTSPLASSTGKTFSIDKDFFYIYIPLTNAYDNCRSCSSSKKISGRHTARLNWVTTLQHIWNWQLQISQDLEYKIHKTQPPTRHHLYSLTGVRRVNGFCSVFEMNSVTVKNMKRKNVWYVLHMKTVRMVMFTTDKCKYHGCKMAKEEVESRLYLETSQKWQIMITMTQ